MKDLYPKEYEKTLRDFLTADGRLKNIPSQRKKKLFVFEHILSGLDPERAYPEQELDDYIRRFHDDHCTIRREFIINRHMTRDQNVYTLNPKEQWAKI
ncbi:DUF2087 domain-containing protein [Tumebacillus permanentifrigoris]|uniref:DUF2087 domain-containing protein n=1 Tax=Tumebacillus permanentifrigoris TaxID=378543 RepID=A0A316D8X4_9BACL|nr:DUF2087 domain-containing protein [Tumebacillus permanentifrigoris]PWK13442.1 hypothetical protein C7459_107110 [Tumebacillus permanentifrigoris]